MGNVLSKDDAVHKHAVSKISDQDINIQNFTQLLVDNTTWSTPVISRPMGRPITVRVFYNVTSAVTISVSWSPDHTNTALDQTAPHWFNDTADTHQINAAAGAQGVVDIPGADLIKLSPGSNAGLSTIMIVALYN